MHQTPPAGAPPRTAPSFYLTSRQPLRPGAILLATVAALAALSSVLFALGQGRQAHLAPNSAAPKRSASTPTPPPADDKDDPNQVDTIVLGDPADAPVAGRRGDHVSPVHPTIIVRLPRFGDEVGLIPDTPSGRLLYAWLAAFNHASAPALRNALPTVAPAALTAAEIELRQQTGGFTLLSAKEAEPGVLVFRLRDQTPAATEVLGTLQLRPNANPAAISSFSLRAVPASHPSNAAAAPL